MARYWFVNCPACQQGRLFVEMQVETNVLMLECEECSRAWASPEQVSPTKNALLAIEITSRFANADEIERHGWSKWNFHEAS
jgi:Zn ribbon nucleic-acid-binding protein